MVTIPVILAWCALCSSEAVALEVSARSREQGGFEVTLTNPTRLDETTAQSYIAQAARSLCGARLPALGKYRFESKEALGTGLLARDAPSFRFVREVTCGDGVVNARQEPKPTLTSPEEERRVREEVSKATEAYFQLVSEGKLEQAYAFIQQPAVGMDKATWLSGKQSFIAAAGAIKKASILKITVYDNPPAAPAPGLYVAADFQNSYEGAPYECGYLMWYRPVGGTFTITRTDSGFVTKDVLAGIPDGQRPELLRKLRCVAP